MTHTIKKEEEPMPVSRLCCICHTEPKLGASCYCPMCQYGPLPAYWPSFVREIVLREAQRGLRTVPPGSVPPPHVLSNPSERAAAVFDDPIVQAHIHGATTHAERMHVLIEQSHRMDEARRHLSPWEIQPRNGST